MGSGCWRTAPRALSRWSHFGDIGYREQRTGLHLEWVLPSIVRDPDRKLDLWPAVSRRALWDVGWPLCLCPTGRHVLVNSQPGSAGATAFCTPALSHSEQAHTAALLVMLS